MNPKQAATIEAIKSERRAITFGDIVATQTIAMQAAVIEFYVGEGSVPAIQWIANTITGPGHFPNLEEAQSLGGAQAWFDKKMAEHDAFRAAHPMPERPVATLEAEPAGWIAVTERLPKADSGPVLVYVARSDWARHPYMDVEEWVTQHEDPLGMGGPTIETGCGWSDNEFENITHWMPLPASPLHQAAEPAGLPAPLVDQAASLPGGATGAVDDGSGSRSANAPLPWVYRKMKHHFAVEAANGVRVADVRYVGRPDGSTSEDVARFIVARANTAQTQEETELTIAADSYEQIAETIGTLNGYSVQEHVGTMKEVIEACADFLHDFDESNPGAVRLAQAVRDCLRGRIDLVDLDRSED